MKRTTISLSDELARAVERERLRRHTTTSALAREALERHLGLNSTEPRELPFANLGGSAHRNTARDMEALLEQEWGEPSRDR